jgi:hypothetical protein
MGSAYQTITGRPVLVLIFRDPKKIGTNIAIFYLKLRAVNNCCLNLIVGS